MALLASSVFKEILEDIAEEDNQVAEAVAAEMDTIGLQQLQHQHVLTRHYKELLNKKLKMMQQESEKF